MLSSRTNLQRTQCTHDRAVPFVVAPELTTKQPYPSSSDTALNPSGPSLIAYSRPTDEPRISGWCGETVWTEIERALKSSRIWKKTRRSALSVTKLVTVTGAGSGIPHDRVHRGATGKLSLVWYRGSHAGHGNRGCQQSAKVRPYLSLSANLSFALVHG